MVFSVAFAAEALADFLAYLTSTDPFMKGWIEQWYVNVPLAKVCM
jgi:hypothetical protein